MVLTFADTHNMIAYLTKSDASEGFDQIINFLNASLIKYALDVNPNIYVSCIKQFWTSVSVKKVNNVTRLQALVDKKKVIIIEAIIRDALRLDDAESIDSLPNEEIFTELSRMGAKRTSGNEFSSSMASAVICLSTGRKFNFSKYIFDSLVRNVDSSTKFYMYPRFLQLMIRAQVGDLSLHSTKYSSPALTQKVFANIKRVGNGFSGVDTTLFEGMIVAHQVDVAADEGAASVAVDDVPAAADEPTIPSPTPTTPPPPPSQDLPSTSQERISTNMDADEDVTLKDVADIATEVAVDAETEEIADVQGRQAKSQAQIYQIDLEHVDKVLSMQDDKVETAELQEVVEVVITAKLITEVVTAASATITAATTLISAATITVAPSAARRRKGVVIRDPEETPTPSIIIHSEPKSKDKGKGIMVEEPKPLKKQAQIEKEKEDNAMMRYQALMRKPQTEAQARKNMMIYLRNMAGFKMDYFKGVSYDDIRPIFEKKFNSNVAFLEKTREHMEEEDIKALKRPSKSQAEKAAKKHNLDEEVEELKRHLQILPNDEDDVYTKATPLALKVPILDYTCVLWELAKERFASSKPKNFSDDFLLTTLTYMFEKPNVEAQVCKSQRGVYGLAKVKSWKLLESCRVYIITLTTTRMIVLVERRYPLTRFTLDQMLNNVRLKVEKESEVSLELLRFVRQQQQDQSNVWIHPPRSKQRSS
nr:hypothetical protein [Tanacetum cinerariifolium]